jgi:hypothetical protein
MGGANKQGTPAGSMPMPEVRKATLPDAQAYRTEMAAQQKQTDRTGMSDFLLGATKNAFDQMSQSGARQPKPLNQWRSVQKYSQNPSSGNLQFTPLSPVEVYDDDRFAVQKGLVSGVGNLASGILSGLSYRGSGSGSNINYQG